MELKQLCEDWASGGRLREKLKAIDYEYDPKEIFPVKEKLREGFTLF